MPKASMRDQPYHAPDGHDRPTPSRSGRRTRWVVHLIERDPAVIDALAQSLGGDEFDLVIHQSGRALLDALTTIRPGCLLIEFDLPDMSALELLLRLRDRHRSLPTVVMTARLRDPLPPQGRPAEVTALLQKPFGRAALLDAIMQALARL